MPTKYIASNGSNANNGDTSATPYQTYAHAIGVMNNGDTALFRRGDTFPAPDYIAKQINIGAYGTGDLPIFSGFVTASGWVNEGSGIWSFTDAGLPTIVNVVSVNGSFQPRVRFAKNGYKTIQSHTGTNYGTITNNTIPNSPSLIGAEIVIRKRRWVIDRAVITGHASGGVLTYANLNSSHNLAYEPFNGYGFFIQNHNSVMTEVGDWRYDGTAKKIYMYFGAGNPSSYIVKISKTARAFHTGDSGGGTYSDIHVTGFNQWGWSAIAPSTLLQGVKFSMIGEHGVYASSKNSVNFNNCIFEDMPNNCVTGEGACNDWSVTSCTFNRIHHWHGAGGSNDTKGICVAVFGDNLFCQYNRFTNFGYEGVYFSGSGSRVENNYFDTFCYVKDDGGAIYTYEGSLTTYTVRRTLKNNIIRNGIGTIEGTNETDLKGFGIYPDERTRQLDIKTNLISDCNIGAFLHNCYDIVIDDDNIFYKNGEQITMRSYSSVSPSTGIVINDNALLGDKLIVHSTAAGTSNGWGSADNNRFYSNVANPFSTRINDGATVNRTFDAWKSTTGQDGSSTLNSYTGETIAYNDSDSPADIPLSGRFVDVSGTVHDGSINLGDHESTLLFAAPIQKILTFGGRRLKIGGRTIVR